MIKQQKFIQGSKQERREELNESGGGTKRSRGQEQMLYSNTCLYHLSERAAFSRDTSVRSFTGMKQADVHIMKD